MWKSNIAFQNNLPVTPYSEICFFFSFSAGLDCLSQLSIMIKALMTPNTDSEMASLLKITEANSSEMKSVLKVRLNCLKEVLETRQNRSKD